MLQRLNELLERGEWVQVKRDAEQLMLLPDLDSCTLGRIYRAGASACIGLGEFHACVSLLELGLPYALCAEDWDTVGFMRHDLGAALLVLGHTPRAREQFVAYLLDLAKYLAARSKEGRAHYNLGLLYRQQKEYGLAVAAYRQALQCFVDYGAARDTGDCHQNIAWLLLVQNRPQDARTHIDLAAAFQEQLPPDFRVEQLVLLAFFHAVTGESVTAHKYLEPILTGRMEAPSERIASAKWVEARTLMAEGDLRTAVKALDEALNCAMAAKAAHVINLCADLGLELRKRFGGAAT